MQPDQRRQFLAGRPRTFGNRMAGFTLVETLVVVALIGLITLAATSRFNSTWQKSRVETVQNELRNFLQSATSLATRERNPVFVRLVPGVAGVVLQITQNADGTGTVYRTYEVPDYVALSASSPTDIDCNWALADATKPLGAGNPAVIGCDVMGRAFAPSSVAPRMVSQAQRLTLTHAAMVDGTLTPKIVYTVQVFPIWQVVVDKTTT